MKPPILTPPVPATIPKKKSTVRFIILAGICFLLFGSAALVILDVKEVRSVHGVLKLEGFKSRTDQFHLTVLEVETTTNSLMERVRVVCEKDMEVGIQVIDLRETGIHETNGRNGELFYRVGNPYKAGQSGPIHADGKFSTCEILYRVSTTLSNTTWHSQISIVVTNASSHSDGPASVDTALPVPLMVSGVQTNWPDSYQRGSWIPLASLGDYKIVVTVK